MKYTKNITLGGVWLKASEIKSGTKAKLVSETIAQPSQFQNKDGSIKNQDVAKLRVDGMSEVVNVSINRASLNALIDAWGEESKDWQGHILTIETEQVRVAGKKVTALYLLPEGYVKRDDQNGYAVIIKEDSLPVIQNTQGQISSETDINVEDIPF